MHGEHEQRDQHTAHHAQSHGEHAEHDAHAEHGGHSDHGGHGAHVDHTGHEAMFRQKFWISLLLTIPVLLFSPMLQDWFGFSLPDFPGDRLVGPDVAIESAGIILVQSNPLDVVRIFELSHATYHKMIQNLLWATGYNVVALPLAAGVLAPFGILLSPALGAVLTSLSTIIVACNAQLLRRTDPSVQPAGGG